LYIPVPPSRTTLGEMRLAIAECTHLPPNSFKLIHSGAVMKGDAFPITALSIRAGSTLQIVGTASPIPGRRSSSISSTGSGKEAPARPTEQTAIKTIQDEMSQVRSNLLPSLRTLHATLAEAEGGGTIVADKDTLRQEHTRLGELLLQSLLRLDALQTDSEWLEARKERKTAVKEVQSLLDHLDGAWKGAAR